MTSPFDLSNKESTGYELCKNRMELKKGYLGKKKFDTISDDFMKKTHIKRRGRPTIPVQCNVCHKKFTSKREHVIHFRTHSNDTYVCPSCKKMCFCNIPHRCKSKTFEKPKRNVWDACKKVLNEKSQQVSSSFVPKRSMLYSELNISLNNLECKNFNSPSNQIDSSLNIVNFVQSSVDQLFGKFKNLNDLQSETKAKNLAEIDNRKFFCSVCGMSFKDVETYRTHYTIHSNEELSGINDCNEGFCEIKEGDEELHVCFTCGWCFKEISDFQAHKLTHVDKKIT